jgi:hypothetical protein
MGMRAHIFPYYVLFDVNKLFLSHMHIYIYIYEFCFVVPMMLQFILCDVFNVHVIHFLFKSFIYAQDTDPKYNLLMNPTLC